MNHQFAISGEGLPRRFEDEAESNEILGYLGERFVNTFKFESVRVSDLKAFLNSIRNTCPRYDEIPIAVYKLYFFCLGPLITKIQNISELPCIQYENIPYT